MAEDYMAALLVLSGDQDRKEARTKLLASIGKDAVIEVINSCFRLGISEAVLAQIASMALDNRAAQSSSLIVAQPSREMTCASKRASRPHKQ